MLQVPLSKEDYFALQRFNMKRFGLSDDAIEKIVGSWYPLIGTRAVLSQLYARGWIAAEEDIIAFLEATFPEYKNELIDNLDDLIFTETAFEYLLHWLVTHQRGRLSPLMEMARRAFKSIDDLIGSAAEGMGYTEKPKQGG